MIKRDKAKLQAWGFIEEKISSEVLWLRRIVSIFAANSKKVLPYCDNCATRKLAMLIVFGGVEAKEIKRNRDMDSFWDPLKKIHLNL